MTTAQVPGIRIRPALPQDATHCGQICYEAFRTINTSHNFPPDIPEPAMSIGLLQHMFSDPGFFCVVAEVDGRIAGSNCMDERSAIAGIGPITVDPSVQNRRVGRGLMLAVLERARERAFPGVRLVQSAFHNRSLALYATLGFAVREPLSVMQGRAIHQEIPGCVVRRAATGDLEICNQLCQRVHGHDRRGEVSEAIARNLAKVTERNHRITGYSTDLAFFGHTVGETNIDVQALIASAEAFGGPGILVPSRNQDLFGWCLEHGLRIVEPLTLMSIGLYNEPKGAFLSSISY